MERNFYTDDFERLLKERSDEFRMYPSKRVWHSIYNNLHPGRKWPSVAVSLLLIAALFITGYWNSNTHNTKATIIASNQSQAGTGNATVDNVNYTERLQQVAASTNSNNTDNVSSGSTNPLGTSAQNTIASVNNSNTGNNVKTVAAYSTNNKRASVKNSYHTVIHNSNKNTVTGYAASSVVNSEKSSTTPDANTIYVSGNSVTSGKEAGTIINDKINNDAAALKNSNPSNLFSITSNAGNNENNIEPVAENSSTVKSNDADNTKKMLQSSGTEKESLLISPASPAKSANTTTQTTNKPSVSAQDKAWVDDYAFYNRSTRKKWKDRAAKEFYITPGVTYRNFSNNSAFDASGTTNAVTVPFSSSSLNTSLSQKPGISLEAGMGFSYTLSKKIKVKTGIQANYTSYTILGEETNHPVLTTLRLTNINTGFPYLDSRTATLANSGLNTAKTHNTTLQLSIPIGFDFKLASAGKLEWYAGSSIQPSFVISGKANLISDDRKNYVADPSLLRHWNLNAGFETFIHYKMNGFTLQAGPQFRYQLLSTYANQYTINENLYTVGLKIGLIKNF